MNSAIKSNLKSLCDCSKVNEVFLVHLLQNDIIDQGLKEEIDHEPRNFKKASKLYEHFMNYTPESDFGIILIGLQVSKNKKALRILSPGIDSDLVDESICPTVNHFNLSLESSFSYGVTPTTKNFIGRIQDLRRLNSFYNNKQNVVLISGLGGVGKTELCKKFVNSIINPSIFQKIIAVLLGKKAPICIWLNGDNPQSLNDSVQKLAMELGQLGITANQTLRPSEIFFQLGKKLLEHSSNKSRLVVIIDNLDYKYEEVISLIKKISIDRRIFIIVASKKKMILDNAGPAIVLHALEETQAKIILQTTIETLFDSEADLLSKLVQNYPIALELAAAFIKEQRDNFLTPSYSVFDYIQKFNEKQAEMLEERLYEFEHNYAMTTLVTLNVTFDKISVKGMEILKVLAFLESDGILLEFLKEICLELDFKVEDFKNALNLIEKYSLVKIQNSAVSIHRLAQKVMRDKVSPEYPRKLCHVIFFICAERNIQEKLSSNERHHFSTVCKHAYGVGIDLHNIFVSYEQILFDHHCLTYGNDVANFMAIYSKITIINGDRILEDDCRLSTLSEI